MFGVLFLFPETTKDKNLRLSLLGHFKNWISTQGSFNDYKLIINSSKISARKDSIWIYFDASKQFHFYVAGLKESNLQKVNAITNEISKQIKLKPELKNVNMSGKIQFCLDRNSNPFKNLISDEITSKFSCGSKKEKIYPKNLELLCEDKEINQKVVFSIQSLDQDKGYTIDINLICRSEDFIPSDITDILVKKIFERKDLFLKNIEETQDGKK